MRNIASRPSVFVEKDGSVYSSPNMTYLPAIPAYDDVYQDETHHPREIKKLNGPLLAHHTWHMFHDQRLSITLFSND
jgi:hypothetical protein